VGKILKTINLVIGAIRPKRVTWRLDKSGTGYEITEEDIDNNFEPNIPDNALGSEKTKKDTDDVFDLYLTDNGIPWIKPKKEIESKSGTKFQDMVYPKFTTDELIRETQTNLESVKIMQETIDHKSKVIKKEVNKSKNKVLDIVHCRFSPEELAREKQADLETRRRLKEMIESKLKIDKETKHGRSTTEELTDMHTEYGKALIEHHKKEKPRLNEQTKFQQKQAELQAKSATQIAQKKIELEEARSEKERIVKLIQEKQSLISEDLKQEKQYIEKLKEKRKNIEKQAELERNFVAEKINKEIEKIENQANLIQKIKKEQENLQAIIHKKQKILEIVKHEKTKLAEKKMIKNHFDMESRKISDELLEDKLMAHQEKDIVKLFDHKKGAQYYLDRYDNEPYFKKWFDTNFPDFTIEDAVGLAIPKESSTLESQSFEADVFNPNKDLQIYIDVYNNDPKYKEWFDGKYPSQSIYEIIGMLEPNS